MAYVEQCLAPTLKRNDLVLPAHKVPGVSRSKQPCNGAYLPQHSPDLTRLRCLSAKSKLRKFFERTIRDLCKRTGSFVPTIGCAECRNYFRHAGHASI